MPDQPIVYAKLMDARLNQPGERLYEHFRKRAVNDTEAVTDLLNDAYVQGLSDGFAQGIAAAAGEEAADA